MKRMKTNVAMLAGTALAGMKAHRHPWCVFLGYVLLSLSPCQADFATPFVEIHNQTGDVSTSRGYVLAAGSEMSSGYLVIVRNDCSGLVGLLATAKGDVVKESVLGRWVRITARVAKAGAGEAKPQLEILRVEPIKTTPPAAKPAAKPMSALHLAESPDEFDPAFPVAPALELAQWVKTYEKDPATEKRSPRLKEAEAQYLEVRKNGKRPWNSQEWMQEPDYYMPLDTRELALECFSRTVIAHEMMKYDDPNFGLLSARIFHNGFAELLGREDLVDGIIAVFEQSAATIASPTNDMAKIVIADLNIEGLCTLCRLSPVRERIKGKEARLLKTLVQVLGSFKASLDVHVSSGKGDESIGFFREPCSVAMMAFVCLKQIDPTKYEAVAPTLGRIRFPKAQRVQDLRAYCEMLLSNLEPVEEQRRHNQPTGAHPAPGEPN